MPHIHWVARENKLGTPKEKDEVNKLGTPKEKDEVNKINTQHVPVEHRGKRTREGARSGGAPRTNETRQWFKRPRETCVVYCNRRKYCRIRNVVVTTFFICSGGNQGGNYLWWRTISLFLI